VISARKIHCVLLFALAFFLGTGCSCSSSGRANTNAKKNTAPALPDGVFSYKLDELMNGSGIFNTLTPTMTLNDWFYTITPSSYDRWVQKEGTYFYREQTLETPFSGGDIVDEHTVVYCTLSFNGGGKQLGAITGKIALTDIPDPATKVYIHNYGKGWWFNGKVDMSNVSGASGTFDWSVPLYEEYSTLNSRSGFALSVLPGGSRYTYEVIVPALKKIRTANANVGKLGTVSIKGVTLSGTLSVAYNGKPVPFVEIHAVHPAVGIVNVAYLPLPGPDAPWSMVLGASAAPREIQFRVIGCSKESWTAKDILFDTTEAIAPIYITSQSVEGIALDLGNVPRKR